MTAPESGVKVRMYRQGLGDCFLLAFRVANGGARYMLIDCGLFLGSPDSARRMNDIARNLHLATGGKVDAQGKVSQPGHLHTVVATHEHWDHLSGFLQAKDLFDSLKIDEVWVAWTEDPLNELARDLRKKRHASLAALQVAVQRLASTDNEQANRIRQVLDFFGAAKHGASDTAAALDYLLGRVESPRYLHPGQAPIEMQGVEGVRVFVLGPPEDRKLLLRSDPSKSHSEVYEKELALGLDTAFYAAVDFGSVEDQLTLDQKDQLELSYPFDPHLRLSQAAARAGACNGFFRRHYGFDKEKGEQAPAWRRVDDDWLNTAGTLALKLDSDTNNTSVALAIELMESGRVLLFPGDAQVGNWLSWQSLSWHLPGENEVTASDLLKRTVFYKVGHHASHNATLREKGLELMESADLVAMIPVHEKFAREVKHWDMPFEPLLKTLSRKTKDRVMRVDQGAPLLKKKQKPSSLSSKEWKDFQKNAVETDLYVEYTVG